MESEILHCVQDDGKDEDRGEDAARRLSALPWGAPGMDEASNAGRENGRLKTDRIACWQAHYSGRVFNPAGAIVK
ncbi:MAG TPA: hypothetical protein VFS96_08655, partial [Nitrolancea sp.]|nr:hypothetical protein [Nitrolancea sp.]